MSYGTKIVEETLSKYSLFKDESPLAIEYVPSRLPHRESQLSFLAQLFRATVEKPGKMNQRVLITGNIGTGKTVVAQRFGSDIMKVARNRSINLRYIHVNCRECRGSLFMVLKKVINEFAVSFPQRGFSSEELLEFFMDLLDDKNGYAILALDEIESLIKAEGSIPLYNLTRLQESRLGKPMRLSLICIIREPEYLQRLDKSTLSTLQQNLIEMGKYSSNQLEDILSDRVELAFKEGAVPLESVKFIADLASTSGDARYSIELLWRAGKYADSESARELTPEHVRKAAGSVYQTFREDFLKTLSRHEKLLLLSISRVLDQSSLAYASMGDVEKSYRVVCEEYRETPRAHTQIWKYVSGLGAAGIISTKKSGKGVRGKTTLVGLASTPASAIMKWLESTLRMSRNIATKPIPHP